MRYELIEMKHKIRLIFEYRKKEDGFNFTALDPETLNIKVFLKDGKIFTTEQIEMVTFNIKKKV